MARHSRRVAAAVVLSGLAMALWWAGRRLPTPPTRSWDDAERWYEQVGPEVATLAVVRVVALGLVLWLLVASALELVTTFGRRPAVRFVADLVVPRWLRRLLHGVAGVSLTASLGVLAPGPGPLDDPRPTSGPVSGTATMHLLPEAPAADEPAAAEPAPEREPAPGAASAVRAGPGVDQVVVVPGDSLWSIAEEALADAGHTAPPEAVVARYWRHLVEVNRARLVVPSNPDLIYPGQVILLPPA